jgi:hypothetical protein
VHKFKFPLLSFNLAVNFVSNAGLYPYHQQRHPSDRQHLHATSAGYSVQQQQLRTPPFNPVVRPPPHVAYNVPQGGDAGVGGGPLHHTPPVGPGHHSNPVGGGGPLHPTPPVGPGHHSNPVGGGGLLHHTPPVGPGHHSSPVSHTPRLTNSLHTLQRPTIGEYFNVQFQTNNRVLIIN